MSYISVNRIIKSQIRFNYLAYNYKEKDAFRYTVDCLTHNVPGPASKRKAEALYNHSHPWEWCQGCHDAYYPMFKNNCPQCSHSIDLHHPTCEHNFGVSCPENCN